MTWRLSDLPVETRLAAEHAAAAEGRSLEAWLIETVRSSLAGAGGVPRTHAVQPPSGAASPRETIAALERIFPAAVRAAPHPHGTEPAPAPIAADAAIQPQPQGPSPRRDPWEMLRARLGEPGPAPNRVESAPSATSGSVVLPFEPAAATHATAMPAPAPDRPAVERPRADDGTAPTRLRPRPALPASPVALLPLSALSPPTSRLRLGGDEHRVAALAVEIAAHGVREPVLVRRAKAPGGYEIIAGERRRLASRRAGRTEIPAVVVDADDATALLLSLAENLGLSDFTPLDEARAYLRLLTEFRLSPATLADRLGIERLHIASSLRLLGLPQRARQAIESGKLSSDQAFRLLDVADPEVAIERLETASHQEASG